MTTFVKSDNTFIVFPRVSSISCHEGEMNNLDLVILSVNTCPTCFSVIFSPFKIEIFPQSVSDRRRAHWRVWQCELENGYLGENDQVLSGGFESVCKGITESNSTVRYLSLLFIIYIYLFYYLLLLYRIMELLQFMQMYSLRNQHVHIYMIILAVCWCEKKQNISYFSHIIILHEHMHDYNMDLFIVSFFCSH